MPSAEHSKVLLVHCLLLPPFFVGVMIGHCFVVHYLVSSFAIHSLGKKDSWFLYFNCLLRSFDSKCSVSLPHGDVGWSTVCDCDVS